MRKKAEGWNIVVAGFWNRMIFTPEWVVPRLFPGPEIETRVALLPVLPLIYCDQQVAMEISEKRLVFRPQNLNDDASLLRAEAMARLVLQSLPETPVQAVGINFGFREPIPTNDLLAIFKDCDDVKLGQQRWLIGERKLTRQLTREANVLNLTMTNNREAVDFDFNFHCETGTNSAALQALAEGNGIILRGTAQTLLREVYHLEIEEDDDHNHNS